jgi:protease-4
LGGVSYVAILPKKEAPILWGHHWLEVSLNEGIVDEKPGWSLLGGGERRTTRSLLDLLHDAKEDPAIVGLILRIEGYSAGWAKTQEIRQALLDFRARSKKVVCFSEMLNNKEYYLASAADKIVLYPAGYLNLTGLRAEIPFVKGTLDKLGIQAELEKRGKYKAAAELVTSDTMSTAYREVENSILDDLYDQMTTSLAQSRKLTPDEVKAKIDKGPYAATEAQKDGLVDTLLYYDQVDSLVQKLWGEKPREIGERAYHRREKGDEDDWGEPPAIAVVYASGDIIMGQSFTDPLTGMKVMGGNTVAAALKQAREDRGIKAVVFRVDSPGGDGLASDIIWHEVVRLREKKKPVVVSMADVAGSGGYYIACAADTIFAMPGTITGSIGVITGKVNAKGLYDKLGIKKEILTRGANADFFSSYRSFTDKQWEQLNRQIEADYRDFVHKVAQGRHKTDDEIHAIAQGRVWTGKQAIQNGLVDKLGGFEDAIACAKRMARIPEAKKVRIVTLPKGKGWFNVPLTQTVSQYKELRDAAQTLQEVRQFEDSPILFRMPPEVTIP